MNIVIPGQAPKTCSVCHAHDHNRLTCPKRPKHTGRHCEECAGLPWRRPRGIRALCICGESWAPEPDVTLTDILEQPCHSRRELI